MRRRFFFLSFFFASRVRYIVGFRHRDITGVDAAVMIYRKTDLSLTV